MNIKGLDSVCIWSENPNELARFYQDVLQLPFDKRLDLPDDTGVQFKIGEFFLFVGYHDQVKGKAKDPYRIMVGFTVDSVQETYEELEPKGVEFILKPSLSPDKSFHVATALDPEGNVIQFYSFDKC